MHEGRDDVTYHHVHAHVNDRVGERRWKERRVSWDRARNEGKETKRRTDGRMEDGKMERRIDRGTEMHSRQ